MATAKQSTTFRLSDVTRARLEEMARGYGISLTDMVEIAVAVLYRVGAPVAKIEDVRAAFEELKPAKVEIPPDGKRPHSRPRKKSPKGDAQ